MRHQLRNKVLIASSLILLLAVIFLFSAQTGDKSQEISDSLIDTIIGKIVSHLPSLSSGGIRGSIRKYAHIFEYFLVSLILYFLLYCSKAKTPVLRSSALSMLLSVMAAALDEWHQTFVPGRSGSIKDVLTDSIGIAVGILAGAAVSIITRKRSNETEK